ncbi:MAG: glycosyltransferase family protein [Bacteroidales bacterium]|jgi:spore coat polysaccharide biosynthesis protein SpsF
MNHPEFKAGFIIQARTGSTRLPGKMTLPFWNEIPIIALLLDRLKVESQGRYPIILATTEESSDDILWKIAREKGVKCFRGDEIDVLKRFINASEQFHLDTIIRICADNPLLDIGGTLRLGQYWDGQLDYLSYQVAGNKPSILSHLGLWGEWVSLKALKRAANLTKDSFYREHVTNFIYLNPNQFNVSFVNAPESVYSRKDIRLTIDTLVDFNLVKAMYSDMMDIGLQLNVDSIMSYLKSRPGLIQTMKSQIEKNKK